MYLLGEGLVVPDGAVKLGEYSVGTDMGPLSLLALLSMFPTLIPLFTCLVAGVKWYFTTLISVAVFTASCFCLLFSMPNMSTKLNIPESDFVAVYGESAVYGLNVKGKIKTHPFEDSVSSFALGDVDLQPSKIPQIMLKVTPEGKRAAYVVMRDPKKEEGVYDAAVWVDGYGWSIPEEAKAAAESVKGVWREGAYR